jgi:hypothetical protein
MCTVCGGMIRGGNLRLGVPRAFKFGIKFDWMHPACYTDSCTRMQRPQGGASNFMGFEVRENTCLHDSSLCFLVSHLHILHAFSPADLCCPTHSNWTSKLNKASSDRYTACRTASSHPMASPRQRNIELNLKKKRVWLAGLEYISDIMVQEP